MSSSLLIRKTEVKSDRPLISGHPHNAPYIRLREPKFGSPIEFTPGQKSVLVARQVWVQKFPVVVSLTGNNNIVMEMGPDGLIGIIMLSLEL